MVKNVILCCDSVGEKLDIHRSNVARLFSLLKRHHPHVRSSWYDPGAAATEPRP